MSSYNVSRRRSAEGGFVAAGGALWVFHMQGIGSFLLHLTPRFDLLPSSDLHFFDTTEARTPHQSIHSLFTELCPHHPTFHFRTPLCESSRVSLASSLSSSSCCFHLIFLCIFLSFLPYHAYLHPFYHAIILVLLLALLLPCSSPYLFVLFLSLVCPNFLR